MSRKPSSNDIRSQPAATNGLPISLAEVGSGNEDQKTSIGDHGRQGLTTAEAEKLYKEIGYNELEHIEISAWKLFALQFAGLMPYILETSCIIALAVGSYEDFAIILIILLANASLGYHEEIKARNCLVPPSASMHACAQS